MPTVEDSGMDEGPPESEYLLRLYVMGMTATAGRTLQNLQALLREHVSGEARIEIIDLLEQPQLAADHKIFAIPTVVRKLPAPMRKVIGDLSDKEQALVGLDLRTGP